MPALEDNLFPQPNTNNACSVNSSAKAALNNTIMLNPFNLQEVIQVSSMASITFL